MKTFQAKIDMNMARMLKFNLTGIIPKLDDQKYEFYTFLGFDIEHKKITIQQFDYVPRSLFITIPDTRENNPKEYYGRIAFIIKLNKERGNNLKIEETGYDKDDFPCNLITTVVKPIE